MLENLLFSLHVVLPVFITILLGFLAVQLGVVSREFMAKLAKLTFNWFLSAQIFRNVYEAELDGLPGLGMAMYCGAATVVAFIIIWLLGAAFIRRKESVGAFVHCSVRGSITVLGLALVRNLAGEAGVAICAPLIAVCIIIYNVLAVLALTKFEKGGGVKRVALDTALRIVKNPLIIAVALGLALNRLHIVLPDFLATPVEYMSAPAVPLSLLCIGAAIDPAHLRHSLRLAAWAACSKTFLTALAVVPIAALLGFRGVELAVIGFVFTMGNPSACYVMTAAMDGDGELAAAATVLSTLLSAFTVTLLLYLLRAFALL